MSKSRRKSIFQRRWVWWVIAILAVCLVAALGGNAAISEDVSASAPAAAATAPVVPPRTDRV